MVSMGTFLNASNVNNFIRVLVQYTATCRRLVDWCRNQMSVCLLLICLCVQSQMYVYISLLKIRITFAQSAIFKL